ncbi:MAG: glutamate mutase L [Porphyromonadaceae bacterium]|nr:glutamate mutase L [Porphyromonadaceae bacterium]
METRYVIITDVGSTTTKARLLSVAKDQWHIIGKVETPTTVEAPDENVMVGVLKSIELLESLCEVPLLQNDRSKPLTDIMLISTSSAGGGLQMVVCGQVSHISAKSAQRAALGGGAILLDTFSPDDQMTLQQRIDRLETLRPDMILLSGGVEGAEPGNFLIEMCDFIREANPKPKFGYSYKLPIIYAGTSQGIDLVKDLLGENFTVTVTENLRPDFHIENLTPTRNAIQNLFVEHVMSQAPGYSKLRDIVSHEVLPTPVAVGEILKAFSATKKVNILAVDIGGATTDVFTVVNGEYTRSVSANYGMSYSIANVAMKAGWDRIATWLPEEANISLQQTMEQVGNKLLFPTTIPENDNELLVEQALAREALRLAFLDHLEIAKLQTPVKGFFSDLSKNQIKEIHVSDFQVIIGSGGVLSNAPKQEQAAMMLIDSLLPQGIVELLLDNRFVMPHLGVFSKHDLQAALDLLQREGLIRLGTLLAPLGKGTIGTTAFQISGEMEKGRHISETVNWGEIKTVPLAFNEVVQIHISPKNGAKWPYPTCLKVQGGVGGIIIDARGRPELLIK